MLCKSLSQNKRIFLAIAISIFFLLNISSVFAVTYATVEDLYGIKGDGTNRTGAYNITFKVRSCDDSACSGESWSSLYTNATYNDISSLSNNQYFQYRAFFYTEDQNYTPMLFNSTVGYAKNIYPTNVTLNVGNDSDTEWNQTGTFDYSVVIDDTNTTPTFTSELNDVLTNQCTCSGCELNTTDRTCKIPFVLSSSTQGKINVSNINISYDLMSLNITCIDQNSNTIETALVEIFTPTGNSTAWKTAYTDSSGKASFTTITGKTYDIKSSKTGYISNTDNTNVGPNGTYTLSMTALIDYIKVYLYDHSNTPISGKTVNIYLANNATVYQTNTTDANGYTEFFVDVQNYDLRVDPAGWNRFYEDILNPYTKRLYGLLVNVTNQNAQAVNNAQVWVYEAGTTTSYNSNTNSSGMITFGLENQSYDISTFKQGVFSRLLRQNVPSTANIELDLTVTDYLDEINRTVHAINDSITNTIIPYLQEINSTTHNSYDYLQNTIYPKVNDANSTIYDVLTKWGIYNATALYEKTNDTYNKASDIYTDTQILLTKWGTYTAQQLYNISNSTYYKTIDIYNDMATATALSSMQTNITWLINNVATQENMTLLSQKLDTINSTVNTIKTQTDCSAPVNSELCTYLNSINTTVSSIYSEMATQQNITSILSHTNWLVSNVATQTNITETFSRLTTINNTVNSISSDLLNINLSLQTKIDNIQNNVTWLIDNVALQENITEIIARLTEINSTTNEIDDYLDKDITNKLTELNTTTQNNYDYLQNTVYTKLNETYNNTQQTLTYIGNPADDENQNTLFGEHAYTQNRIGEINSNLTYLKTLTEHINETTEAINSTVSTILLEVDDLKELHQCSISPNSTICTLLNNIYADTQNIYDLSLAINQTTSSMNLFSISALIAGSPRYANENALIEATFIGQNGSYITPDTINLTIWDPTYLSVWDTATKSDFAEKGSNHIWWYSKTISGNPTTGMYYVHMQASYNNISASRSAQFRIATGGPYMVFLECPSSSNVGENLACTVKIQDEGEAATESTSTVWVDTNNNGVADAGEPQSSFSKQTTPLQNVTQSVSINIPSTHSTGLYVVRVDTSYANSAQPNSGASDSVTFSTASAGGGDTEGGSSGGSSSSASSKPTIIDVQGSAIVSKQQIMNGVIAQIETNEKLTINFQPSSSKSIESYTVTISKIEANRVTLVISSNPITLQLAVGEEKEIDIDGDWKNDIYFKLNKIDNGKADLLIKQLSTKSSSITGKTIEHPEHLMDIATKILEDYKIAKSGEKVLMEVTLYNLGTEGIKDATIKYCIKTSDKEIIKCSEETVAIYTKIQVVKEFLLPKNLENGLYYITTEVTYNNDKAYSETTFEVKGGVFNARGDLTINSLLPISLGIVISILLLTLILIIIFRRRGKHKKIGTIKAKLQHLKELRVRKEISQSVYHKERERLLQKVQSIFEGKTMLIVLLGIGLFALANILTGGGMVGYSIKESGSNNPITMLGYFILLIGAFGLLVFVHKQKIKEGIEKVKGNIKKKYSNNSLLGLIDKKVYSEKGDYMGKVIDTILKENKIESLKIKLDKNYKIGKEGIIISYKGVKKVGEIILVENEVYEKLNKE